MAVVFRGRDYTQKFNKAFPDIKSFFRGLVVKPEDGSLYIGDVKGRREGFEQFSYEQRH